MNYILFRAEVTVTDLEDLQSLLEVNIRDNQALVNSGSITAKVLKWFVLLAAYSPFIICMHIATVNASKLFE